MGWENRGGEKNYEEREGSVEFFLMITPLAHHNCLGLPGSRGAWPVLLNHYSYRHFQVQFSYFP